MQQPSGEGFRIAPKAFCITLDLHVPYLSQKLSDRLSSAWFRLSDFTAVFTTALFCVWSEFLTLDRAPDKVCISISKMSISSPNPMFDHLLESSHRDDSNKWSNIGFCEDRTKVESIEVHFTHLIWSPVSI